MFGVCLPREMRRRSLFHWGCSFPESRSLSRFSSGLSGFPRWVGVPHVRDFAQVCLVFCVCFPNRFALGISLRSSLVFVTKLTSLCIIFLIRLRVSAMEISKLEAMFISLPRVEKLKSLKVEKLKS